MNIVNEKLLALHIKIYEIKTMINSNSSFDDTNIQEINTKLDNLESEINNLPLQDIKLNYKI